MRRYLIAAAAFLLASAAVAQPTGVWAGADGDPVVMVVHGGAGGSRRAGVSPATVERLKEGLESALRAGHGVLHNGGTSVDAAVAAIEMLEDDSLFNAGRGAVLTFDGDVRLDASIMDGGTGMAGASAGTRHVRHPIALARDVMRHSPHVMLAGEGAEEFARARDLEIVPAGFFVTADACRDLARVQAAERAREAQRDSTRRGNAGVSSTSRGVGTVGAVALDQAGHLAAGTSTGGMTNKRWDRIGDSPIIGAGTYASDRTCAVSATGHGEYFIRLAVAHDIHARAAYLGETCEEAGRRAIEGVTAAGAEGGVITLDARGRASFAFNTSYMARGTITRSGVVHVGLFSDEGP